MGVDFSGDHDMWGPGCSKSNVWIAVVQPGHALPVLHALHRVQQLSGSGHPFDRLAAYLAAGAYAAAAIDAPFSVPQQYVPQGGHAALLLRIASGSSGTSRRFLDGPSFVTALAGASRVTPPKPLRKTEEHWTNLGVNTRSTMWTGARGGAPMTSACVALLHRAARPMWPWSKAKTGSVVEAFPAAQLRDWNLPSVKYNGASPQAHANRKKIVATLANRVGLGSFTSTVLGDADALDAVLCAFAASAVSSGQVAVPPPPGLPADEGWIAVHT